MAAPTRLTIGRRGGNDVVIDDDSISRHHAELRADADGALTLHDLGSTNGTFVAEDGGWRRVESAPVGAEARLRLGQVETTVAELLARERADRAPAVAAKPSRRLPSSIDPWPWLRWAGAGAAAGLLMALVAFAIIWFSRDVFGG